ncbi:MAG TPA: ribonuclease Z [Candidatus Omnitrophota bacterium]|nr:ribonuclease Z [Candidatus Omnitrophota bacterium]
MKAYFLGTNGWYDTNTGNTVCTLLDTKDSYIIFDAGNGFYKIDRYIKTDKPINLFLSHFHLDHVSGLHILAKFNFKQGLDIYGPAGLKRLFKEVINAPYSMPIKQLKMPVRLHEVNSRSLLPAGIEYKPLKHSSVCYGYRVEKEGKTVAYCTDTGVCRNLLSLACAADLLIAECSFKQGQKNLAWPHLNPESAGKIAKDAKAKKLVLVHFDAEIYRDLAQRKQAAQLARKFFREAIFGYDNLQLKI